MRNLLLQFVRAINITKLVYNTVKSCVKYKDKCSEFFNSDIGFKQGHPVAQHASFALSSLFRLFNQA